VKRGELWLAELDKRRPAVIFRAVPWLNEIHIVPITSTIRGLPSEIEIFGLPKASVANAQRLMLLPKAQLVRRVGSVPEQVMDELTDAICAVLGC
jgi:mRNA-degrading endonuclease toxin of MazEF toxin-antitoxin module